jgi:hypothetical protein
MNNNEKLPLLQLGLLYSVNDSDIYELPWLFLSHFICMQLSRMNNYCYASKAYA